MQGIQKELVLRALAKKDFYSFVKLKWERYNLAPFMDSWHIKYLCKVLECTQPSTADGALITRLMINMPPSYGKTEIIARCFIAWSLGLNRARKFFYISYSDDLCRKIANQVRDLMKSKFYAQVFPEPLEFLQDNAQEFVLREGGGLFVTTLKSALTGFHAHQILIDDPIKVSEMASKTAVKSVNSNFKESVLSRLQDNESNITILMRLGLNDLCGFLQSDREFDPETIEKWKVVKLQALNEEAQTYSIKDFSYERGANEPLFAARHNLAEPQALKLQMGNDEFSAQYQQEPIALSGGYFDEQLYTNIFLHEVGQANVYIFVDNAISLKESADNRAVVVVGVENYKGSSRFVVMDCFCGVFSEEQTMACILEAKSRYLEAKTYIESDGGGLTLHRLLLVELVKHNQRAKEQGKAPLNDLIYCYTPSRKVSKVEKIKAIRPFYNTGFLVFAHSCHNQEQIKKELFSFNPDKPFRQDDCIDAIASCLAHPEATAPVQPSTARESGVYKRRTWRI